MLVKLDALRVIVFNALSMQRKSLCFLGSSVGK
jgi:hypothetical protein